MTVSPAHHAVLLAAHSWQHEPFRRVIDLVDVAVMASESDPDTLAALAQRWRLGGIWRSTIEAIASFQGGDPPRAWTDRMLTQHLRAVRPRTTAELRLARWFAGYRAPTLAIAAKTIIQTVAEDLSPAAEDSWSAKMGRIPRTVRNSLSPSTERVW